MPYNVNNSSEKEITAYRRDLIGCWRLRGLTLREMAGKLSEMGLGPTDWRLCLTLIYKDLKFLETQWQANAALAIEKLKARQLAELAEIKRWGWDNNEVLLVLKALTLETAMTGTKVPDKAEVKGVQEVKVTWGDKPIMQDLFDGAQGAAP